MPTVKEIQRAIGRTSAEKAAGDNGTPAEFYQALASSEEGLEHTARVDCRELAGNQLRGVEVVQAQDPAEKRRSQRPQQLASHHAPRRAPEDNELSDRARLQDLLKVVGIEEQYGFLINRDATTDGVVVVKEATNKRRNAGDYSWVLFVERRI